MKILVTGGAGYLGWSLTRELAQDPAVEHILVYDNFARGNYGIVLNRPTETSKLSIWVDDILNSRGLRKAMEGYDCVCHVAALAPSPFSDENPHAFDQVNHWGTAEVCHACDDLGIERLVYVSSGAIYGFGTDEYSVASSPLPATAYGRSKLDGERQVLRASDRRSTIVIRAGTIYNLNPVARFDTFINRFVLDAALGRPLNAHGSGDQTRPVVNVNTLASVVAAAATGKIPDGTHDAVETNISVNEVIRAIREIKPKIDVIHSNQQARLRDLKIKPMLNIEKFSAQTYSIQNDIEQMLDEISLK